MCIYIYLCAYDHDDDYVGIDDDRANIYWSLPCAKPSIGTDSTNPQKLPYQLGIRFLPF